MDLAQWFSGASIRFYERIRSPRAAHAVADAPTGSWSSLASRKYALVITHRDNGDAVPTPVWFGLDGDRLYVRSVATGRKLERIANNPHVLLAPCTANGKPTGPPLHARARILTAPGEEADAEAALRNRYGVGRRIYASRVIPHVPGHYVEVRPTAPSS